MWHTMVNDSQPFIRPAPAIRCTGAVVSPLNRPNFDSDSAKAPGGLVGGSSCQKMPVQDVSNEERVSGVQQPEVVFQNIVRPRRRGCRLGCRGGRRSHVADGGKCQAAGACRPVVRHCSQKGRQSEIKRSCRWPFASAAGLYSSGADRSESDSHTATTTMIADVRSDSVSGDSSPANQASTHSAMMPTPCES